MSDVDIVTVLYNTVNLTYHTALFRKTPGRLSEYHSYAVHITGFESLEDARSYAKREHPDFVLKESLIYWNGEYPKTFKFDYTGLNTAKN